MKIIALAIATASRALLLGACSSHNVPTTTTGTLGGSINVEGPFNGATELLVGLFAPGGTTPLQSATAGHVTSTATATLSGRAIAFSFTEIDLGTYEVGLYSSGPGGNTFYFRSDPVTLDSTHSSVTDFSADASFTGEGPFGSISGVALLSDDFEFPSGGNLAFLGFSPASDPQNALQWIVTSEDASNGELFFNVDHIAYGTWIVGLYGYNPVTHEVSIFGLLDNPLTVNENNPNLTGAVFAADSDGDPGTDPVLGTINGTVTFNGALPEGQAIFVAANTVPPQQGAPPSTQEVTALDGRTFNFSLPLLPDGSYSVSIFSYDFASHQAVYFGEAEGTVTIDDAHQTVSDINFDADVTVIGGTAD
jgi:hypothetical protein